MRLLLLVALCAVGGAAVADEVPTPPLAVSERPPGALDSVVLQSGEVVRGVIVREDASSIAVVLRSGEQQTFARAGVKVVGRWVAPPPVAVQIAAPPPALPTRWYGWQTLASDAGALGLFGVFLAADGTNAAHASAGVPLGVASGALFLLGPPVIHLWRGQPRAGFASLGLRVALPLLGGLIVGRDWLRGGAVVPEGPERARLLDQRHRGRRHRGDRAGHRCRRPPRHALARP